MVIMEVFWLIIVETVVNDSGVYLPVSLNPRR